MRIVIWVGRRWLSRAGDLGMVYARRPTDVQAVLFDFDETLVDLRVDWEPVRRSVGSLAKASGVEGEFWEIVQEVLRARDIMAMHRPAGLDHLAFTRQAFSLIEAAELAGLANACVVENAPEIIRVCLEWNKKVAVVSSNSRRVILEALERFQFPSVTTLVTRESVDEVKPDPEPLLTACRLLRVAPANAIYVGNAGHDVAAAEAAGVFPVVLERSSTWVAPPESGVATINDLLELFEYI